MRARLAASPIRSPAIPPVWHLELDFKVKTLDPEVAFNVYKGQVPVTGPAPHKEDHMKAKLIALATTVLALVTSGAFAASRLTASGGACPPCPFCR